MRLLLLICLMLFANKGFAAVGTVTTNATISYVTPFGFVEHQPMVLTSTWATTGTGAALSDSALTGRFVTSIFTAGQQIKGCVAISGEPSQIVLLTATPPTTLAGSRGGVITIGTGWSVTAYTSTVDCPSAIANTSGSTLANTAKTLSATGNLYVAWLLSGSDATSRAAFSTRIPQAYSGGAAISYDYQ